MGIVVDRFDRLAKSTRSVILDSLLYKSIVMCKNQNYEQSLQTTKSWQTGAKDEYLLRRNRSTVKLGRILRKLRFRNEPAHRLKCVSSMTSLFRKLAGEHTNHGSLIRESRSVIRALRSRMDGKSITPLPL